MNFINRNFGFLSFKFFYSWAYYQFLQHSEVCYLKEAFLHSSWLKQKTNLLKVIRHRFSVRVKLRLGSSAVRNSNQNYAGECTRVVIWLLLDAAGTLHRLLLLPGQQWGWPLALRYSPTMAGKMDSLQLSLTHTVLWILCVCWVVKPKSHIYMLQTFSISRCIFL